MNSAEELSDAIHRELADASVSIDRPEHAQGYWWIDVMRGDRKATVEWRPEQGFGVGLGPGGYGEGPDIVVSTVDEAARRVVDYLLTASREWSALVGSDSEESR